MELNNQNIKSPKILPPTNSLNLALIASDLQRLINLMPKLIPVSSNSAKMVIDKILSTRGKLVRPSLFYLSSNILGYNGQNLDKIAAVGEFIHMASLLHDDVIDNSTLRRGRPTASSVYGDETAILVGDMIYSTASELMAETNNMKIVETFARTIRLMSDGELVQLENLYNTSITQKTYFAILEYKTAVLTQSVCAAAALLADASAEQKSAIMNFGFNVGIAFQLIDDALDYSNKGDSDIGKTTLKDLPEGKITLPIILLKKLATKSEFSIIEEMCRQNNTTKISASDMAQVLDLVQQYKTNELTLSQAKMYSDAAMNSLKIFSPSLALETLVELTKKLLVRNY